MDGKTSKPWQPMWWYAKPRTLVRWCVLAVPAVGFALVIFAERTTKGCADFHLAMAFGITPTRVSDLTTDACALSHGDITGSMVIDSFGALLYGVGLALVLLAHWRRGWRSRRQGAYSVAKWVALVPIAAGAFDLIENILIWSNARVHGKGPVALSTWAALFISTAGITKWILVWAALLAVALTLYGVWRFRCLQLREWTPEELAEEASPQVVPSSAPPAGTAVCLSGGGIRSASFSWGALAQLEQAGNLTSTTAIYSVSGGGYAASAWTSAGPRLRAALAADFHQLTPAANESAPATTPFQHLQRNHRYLSSRLGGLGLAIAKALMSIVVNLTVIIAGLVVVAVPVGMLSRTRFGAIKSAVPEAHDAAKTPVDHIRPGVWLPVLCLLALAALAVLSSFACGKKARRTLLILAESIAAVAATVTLATVVLPWLAHRLDAIWEASWWAALPAAVTWIGGVLFAAIRPRLSKMAIRLGGVVSGLAMAYTFVYIVRRAVAADATPGWDWLPDPWDDASWVWLFAGAIVLLVAVDRTGVQWWSLHPLYRDRLAGAFVMEQVEEQVEPREWESWPRWSAVPAAGPTHVVCASTHRRETSVTGLRSVSFRFSREGVMIHEPVLVDHFPDAPRGQYQVVGVRRFGQTAGVLDDSLGAHGATNTRRSHLRASQIAAAAMSGAAFNSVMGRQSKGSTDSLLAVLNLRLGVWMPNPRFRTKGGKPFPRAGLRYLFHEVIGHFDLEDPFVHVSDGGHWENLGLTEALRDRRKRIIVVDATGGHIDPPTAGEAGHGFASLHEAIDLARIELATEIRIDVTPMRPLASTGRAPQNWATGTITYHRDRFHDWTKCADDPRCHHGELVYVKAVVCDRTPDDVLAYANTDRVFPDYPTGDQFLSDDQFMALVNLGRSATNCALG